MHNLVHEHSLKIQSILSPMLLVSFTPISKHRAMPSLFALSQKTLTFLNNDGPPCPPPLFLHERNFPSKKKKRDGSKMFLWRQPYNLLKSPSPRNSRRDWETQRKCFWPPKLLVGGPQLFLLLESFTTFCLFAFFLNLNSKFFRNYYGIKGPNFLILFRFIFSHFHKKWNANP